VKRFDNNLATDGTFRSLVLTMGAFKRVMEPYFAGFGIGGSQWGVLRTLARAHDEGLPALRLRDLSDRLVIRPPSVTEVVNRLHRMGLVSSTEVATDQRAKHVRLTPAGKKLVRRVLGKHPEQIETVLGGLSRDERKQLGRLLDRLKTHLESLAQPQEIAASSSESSSGPLLTSASSSRKSNRNGL
jgi:DNA-binding MarR family transcriptional regulator